MSMRTGLCVPTYNAGSEWKLWLSAYNAQTICPDVSLIIDSSSHDDTAAMAREAGLAVHQIDKAVFDHGATRQLAVSMIPSVDIVIFLTQDAVLSRDDSLSRLLEPFKDASVAAVCGRQLPRKHAVPTEAHARLYNYTSSSFVRSIADIKNFGLKTAFLSNSFAAYRVSALNEVGGFPNDVIFGEDMYVAAKLLMSGYKIAYEADACVYHSHNYTVLQEFSRYFDMGVFHAREPWLRQELGTAESEGLKFVVSEIKYLLRHAFWMIPAGMLRTIMRYVGFRMGLSERHIPLNIKQKISMNPGYFKME